MGAGTYSGVAATAAEVLVELPLWGVAATAAELLYNTSMNACLTDWLNCALSIPPSIALHLNT
jgi:hypothetical protein